MLDKDSFYKLQKAYYRNADTRRFYNRLENPYIAQKEKRLARLIALRFPRYGRKLLEIGCGEGSNLYFLRRSLPNVSFTGIDFSQEKIDFLRSNCDGITAICCDATNLPLGDKEYDLVLCRDLLHHVHFAQKQVIAEAFRVLRQGGVVVILESDGRRFLNRVFRALLSVERGMRYAQPSRLLELARSFAPAELEYVEASFLIRASAFFLGWHKQGILRRMVSVFYTFAKLWERSIESLLPKSRWTYMMITIRKG